MILRFEIDEFEEVIFGADEDNNGKGVSVDEMIKLLKKNL